MGVLQIVNQFFRRRLLQPVIGLFSQGMTPRKMGATLAVGTVVGIIPALGITTVLATGIAARFRLNIAATVLVSYLVQPLQILFAIPFIKLGIFIFGLEDLKLTFDEIQAMFKADWLIALNQLWQANLAGVVAWLLVSLPIGWGLYFLLVPLLKVVMPKQAIALTIETETLSPEHIPLIISVKEEQTI